MENRTLLSREIFLPRSFHLYSVQHSKSLNHRLRVLEAGESIACSEIDCWESEWVIFRFLTYKSSYISLVLPFSWICVLNYCFGNKCRIEWQNQNPSDIIKHRSTLFKEMIILHKYSAIIPKGKCLILLQDFLLANNNFDTHNMKNGDTGIRKILLFIYSNYTL